MKLPTGCRPLVDRSVTGNHAITQTGFAASLKKVDAGHGSADDAPDIRFSAWSELPDGPHRPKRSVISTGRSAMIGRSLPGMLFNPMILLGNVSLPGRCSLLRQFIRFAAWGAICWAPSQALAADSVKPSEKPNIVFILADDLGWSDTTLNGTTRLYRTPNLERLAKRGMTFRNAYAASPLCSPTRASIMTGLYPGRIGITDPSGTTRPSGWRPRWWFAGNPISPRSIRSRLPA